MLRGMLRNKRQSIFPPGWNVGFNQEIWTVFSPSFPPFFLFLSVFLKKIQICDLCVSLSEEFQTEKHILFKKYFLTSSYCLISCHVPISRHHCLTLPSWPLPISNNILSFTVCRVNTLKPSFFKSLRARLLHNVPFMRSKTDFSGRGMWPPRMVSMWVSNLPSRAAPGLDIPGCITLPAWHNDSLTHDCSILGNVLPESVWIPYFLLSSRFAKC